EGWNGVTLFFVLSGFLITTLALREEDALGALRWRAFFVRRLFRIVPVYVVSLGLYVVAVGVVGIAAGHRGSFFQAVPWYLSPFPEVPFFSRTHIVFSLAWSLGIEEKFYLLWPLLAFVLLRRRARGRLGLALALMFVLQIPIAFGSSGRALAPYSAILAGCILAFLMHKRSSFARLSRFGSTPFFLGAAALLVVVHGLTHIFNPTAPGFRVAAAWYYLPYSLAAALVVRALALRAGADRRSGPRARHELTVASATSGRRTCLTSRTNASTARLGTHISAAASSSVPRTPRGPESGPASAWPTGIRQSESSQSIEPTRASRSGRTSCCSAVSQRVFPKMIVRVSTPLAAMIRARG